MFKAYDVRGTVGCDFTTQDFANLGTALALWLKNKNINTLCLGNDTRPSAPMLTQALISGLLSENIYIILQQQITTPMLVWSMRDLNEKACAMITASHNPWEDNGLKIYLNKEHVHPVCDEELLQIKSYMHANHIIDANPHFNQHHPNITHIDLADKYIQSLPLNNNTDILWDASFGGASRIVQKLGKHINTNLDNFFLLKKGPNPAYNTFLPDHPLILSLDGDGDRLQVTYKGHTITAEEVALTFEADKIIHDPHITQAYRSNLSSETELYQARVGHSNIQKMMIQHKADLGFEASGHFFFKSRDYMDDAIYAGLKFVENIDKYKPIIGHISPIYRIPTAAPELLMNQMLQIGENDQANICLFDGVKLTYHYGWILARKSNTENCLSVMFEAIDASHFALINKKFSFLFYKN